MFGIVKAQHGPAVGPPSEISYDVSINTPSGVTLVTNVFPGVQRVPEDLDVIAFAVGDPVVFANVDSDWRMVSQEIPAYESCDGGNGVGAGFNPVLEGARLLATIAAMTDEQRQQLKGLLA